MTISARCVRVGRELDVQRSLGSSGRLSILPPDEFGWCGGRQEFSYTPMGAGRRLEGVQQSRAWAQPAAAPKDSATHRASW